jgi:cation diffusion facilitator family transporter
MSTKSNIRFQFVVVTVGFVLLIMKFYAYWITNSSTVLTDALESIINVVAGSFGLYSLILSSFPKDKNHPYGHGRVEFISAAIEGGLVFFAGIAIVLQSTWSLLFDFKEIQKIDLGLIIVIIAGIINYLIGYFTEKQGKKSGSLALIASAKHLKTDAYSTLALIFGLVIIFVINNIYKLDYWAYFIDNSVAILFGIIILWSGYGILRESVARIMDEVDYKLVDEIVLLLNANKHENWIDVHNLRIIRYGSSLHIDCHLTVPWYFNTREAHDEVDRLEVLLKSKLERSTEVFVHVDPCIENSCSLCDKLNCAERRSNYNGNIKWTSELIMNNKKHSLQ